MRSRLLIADLASLQQNELQCLHQYVEFQDDAVYTVKWEQGHSSTAVLQNPKCSVLAESSVEAFCDHYYATEKPL